MLHGLCVPLQRSGSLLWPLMTLLRVVSVYDDTNQGQYGSPRCVVYCRRSLLSTLDVSSKSPSHTPIPTQRGCAFGSLFVFSAINGNLSNEKASIAVIEPLSVSEGFSGSSTNTLSEQPNDVVISTLLSIALCVSAGDSISLARCVGSASTLPYIRTLTIQLPWRRLDEVNVTCGEDNEEDHRVNVPSSVLKTLLRNEVVLSDGVIGLDCFGYPMYAHVHSVVFTSESTQIRTTTLTPMHERMGVKLQSPTSPSLTPETTNASTGDLGTRKLGRLMDECEVLYIEPDLHADLNLPTVSEVEMYMRMYLGYTSNTVSELTRFTTVALSNAHEDVSRCLLLHGPSGSGKSYVVRAIKGIFSECGVICKYVSGAALFTTNEGEAEQNLYDMFNQASTGNRPRLLIIDDVDALCPLGSTGPTGGSIPIRRLSSMFLSCLQSVNKSNNACGRLTVIGVTSRLHVLDTACISAGRFEVMLHLNQPDVAARLGVLGQLTGIITTNDTNASSVRMDVPTHMLSDTEANTNIQNPQSTERYIYTNAHMPTHLTVPLDKDAQSYLPEVARVSHGFNMADLKRLSSEAALHAIRRRLTVLDGAHMSDIVDMKQSKNVSENVGVDVRKSEHSDLCVRKEDFDVALTEVSPSSLVEFKAPGSEGGNSANERVTFSSLKGMCDVLSAIEDSVLMPLKNLDMCAFMGIPPPAGLLLAGPHGTGKTTLAMAIANETKLRVIVINGSEIRTRIVGESEKALTRIFQHAREAAPCMLLLEQIDIIASTRQEDDQGSDRLLTTLLTEMDGVDGPGGGLTKSVDTSRRVLVVGTTTRAEALDRAIVRPGRLDLHFHLQLPNDVERVDILTHYLQRVPGGIEIPKEVIRSVALEAEGYSGADLESIARETAMNCLRDNIAATKP
eukprot:CFRG4695T1